jgi:hypothetical protein
MTNDCTRFQEIIEAIVAGVPTSGGADNLARHCRTCPDCVRALEAHQNLSEVGRRFRASTDGDLDELRSRVLVQLAAPPRRGWLAVFSTPFTLQPALAAVFTVVIFLTGLGAAWIQVGGDPGILQRLRTEITAEAASNRSLVDVEDSRYTYSNVTFRRLDDRLVSMDFDVTTHVNLVEPVESELVKEVLVHSLLNPSNTGSRLKAITYASNVMEPKVRDSVIFAMHNDENLAVRLQALSFLAGQPVDPTLESAVTTTLLEDPSVQMRLEALDYLATHTSNPESIRRAIEQTDDAVNAALMVRLADYDM